MAVTSMQITCEHLIRIDWLGQSLAVFKSAKQARKAVRQIDAPAGCPGSAGYATRDDGQMIFWMVLSEPSLPTIAHEAVHIADFLCEAVGIPVSVECGEVRAYLVGWLVGEISQRYGMLAPTNTTG